MSARATTTSSERVRFLQWALPRLGYRWSGFRKVRRQVIRRIERRVRELDLPALDAYRERLEADRDEWLHLDECCRVTISRFYRDRHFWEILTSDVLPAVCGAAAERALRLVRIWSAGCGAGEEPYSVALSLALGRVPLRAELTIEIVATDLDPHQLARAERAVYPASSVRELPVAWRQIAFHREPSGDLRLDSRYRRAVDYRRLDIRHDAPEGPFDLILCRNLAFTYFDDVVQRACLERLLRVLAPSGWLGIGGHETLPPGAPLAPHPREASLYRAPATPD